LWNSPDVQRHRLLLVPSFTELEWGIRAQLEEWADVVSFDMPGVGDERLPDGVDPDARPAGELVRRWRRAASDRALEEPDRRGWDRFFVVADSRGVATAVAAAARRRDAVQGLAIGHAALSKATEGVRPPERAGLWDALAQLAKQGNETFVRYGIAQATRGGYDEETARRMIERFPDMGLVSAMIEALGREPEPIGDQLAALGLPLLLAKHEGCLGSTDEGFEDIVAAFPDAETVICPETCSSSPAYAGAIRRFCDHVGAT
jgi:pimeloyl-ACP methyl ester carboxylesterase